MKVQFTLLLLLIAGSVCAQDPGFSQYYAAPLYLNPAFAGTSPDHRLIANHRNQWPGAGRGFQTYAMSYDVAAPQLHSGFGVLATVDKAGSAGLRSTNLNLIYSYKLNIANKWVIATGLNFGYGFRTIEMNKLIFGDQLLFDGNNAPTDDPAGTRLGMAKYFDFGTGVLAYNRSFWLGAAVSHLNQPNRSMLGEEAIIPAKYTLHGGISIPLQAGPFKRATTAIFAPSFVYKRQDRFEQLDIGAYLLYEPIVLGLWYRGIPVTKNAKSNISQDALVVVIGFQFDRFEVGYSYDMTVSELGPLAGGAHEISLKYKAALATTGPRKKKEKFIPCPTFLRKQEPSR